MTKKNVVPLFLATGILFHLSGMVPVNVLAGEPILSESSDAASLSNGREVVQGQAAV